MKKKQYERPTMLVVELKQRPQLLAGSGVYGSREDYGEPEEWNWE